MEPVPREFFIGLMDFFSNLLPGALLTWLLMREVGPVVLGDRYAKLGGAQAWAALLFASYLFGHLVFLLGSWLDEFYDWVRRYTLNTQIMLLARALVWLVFKRERNLAVDGATKIKQQALGPLQAKDAIKTFQWSKALLNVENPTSLAVVQRFEADSKFFRCFTVVLLILLVAWPWQDQWPPAGIPIVLAPLSLTLWPYMKQLYKTTDQAYWYVIPPAAKDGRVAPDTTATEARNHTHASGVLFHLRGPRGRMPARRSDQRSDAMGTARGPRRRRRAAPRNRRARSALGNRLVGTHRPRPGRRTWSVDGAVVTTHFVLMQAVGRGLRKDKDRQHVGFHCRKSSPRRATSKRASCCRRQSSGDRALQVLHPLLQRSRLQPESESTGRNGNEKGKSVWPTPLRGG